MKNFSRQNANLKNLIQYFVQNIQLEQWNIQVLLHIQIISYLNKKNQLLIK